MHARGFALRWSRWNADDSWHRPVDLTQGGTMTQTAAKVRYLTTAELGQRINTPGETVRFWRHVGKGPRSVKFGRRVLYHIDDVEEWELTARESAGTGVA